MIGLKDSLRFKLVLSIGLSMVALMLLVASGVYWAIQHESDEIFKARLNTSARVLEGLISRQINQNMASDSSYVELDDAIVPTMPGSDTQRYEQKVAFQVWSEMGVLLAKSSSAPFEPLGAFREGQQSNSIDKEEWQVFALKSGPIWVLAAEHNDVLEESRLKLLYAVFTPFVIGVSALILLVNFLLFRGLRPLRDLAAQIATRDINSLIPLEGRWPSELKSVVSSFNGLLVSVKAAIEREKLFMDSAAHEIRTPIAGIHLHLQNALNGPDARARADSVQSALDGVRRVTQLIRQMLLLSRVGAGFDPSQPKSFVAVDLVAAQLVDSMTARFKEKNQTVHFASEADLVVRAELGQVESLLGNLLDNAQKYGEQGGCIDIDITRADNSAVIRVANSGQPIAVPHREAIFTPYFRVTESTVAAHEGAGLGLAIAARIVENLQGCIVATDPKAYVGVEIRATVLLVSLAPESAAEA